LGHLYFPTTSIVSLLYVMESGASAEIAIIGNDGLVGVFLFMGRENTPSGDSAERRQRLSAQGEHSEKGIRARRTVRTLGAAIHPGDDYEGGPDRRLLPASHGRPAVVPLAAAVFRPAAAVRPGVLTALQGWACEPDFV